MFDFKKVANETKWTHAMLRPESFLFAAILTGLVALGPISTDMYLPSLPALKAELGASVSQVQLTLSVFLGGFAISQLFYGPLSDRFGRRPVLIFGITIYCLASIACFLSTTIEGLILARFFQAFGACSGPAHLRLQWARSCVPAVGCSVPRRVARAAEGAPGAVG